MNRLFNITFLLILGALFATACGGQVSRVQSVRPAATYPMLKPGDRIDEMNITTGADEAVPLWAFCLPTVESDHRIMVNCSGISYYPRLAIGYTFGLMDLVPPSLDWSELTWELYLDEQPIDLGAFGTYDFVHPDLALSPVPIREVFRKVTVWDIVLVNPTPGVHILQGVAKVENETYTWVANFAIETARMPQ